jgi:hypothetical protein
LRLRRLFQYLGVSERDVLRQLFARGRKTDGAATTDAASAVDEGIEHDAEELVGELKPNLLRAGRGFSGEQRERIAETDAGEPEDGDESRWQRAAVVEEGIERIGDVALVDAEGAGERAGSARRAGLARRARADELAERGGEVEDRIGRGVAQRCGEAGRQIARGQRVERGAAKAARGREDRIRPRRIAARGKRCLHGAGKHGAAGRIGARRGR